MTSPTITPNIVVDGGLEALDFYARAFGGEVTLRMEMDGKLGHGEITIGNSVLAVADPFPDFGFVAPEGETSTQSISVQVEDCDAAHAQAVAAGATELDAPQDQPYGVRTSKLRCPYGHRWTVSGPLAG